MRLRILALSVGVAALTSSLGANIALAANVENVEIDFGSGAVFDGKISFSSDFSYITAVRGTLSGYDFSTPPFLGSYTPGASDTISWVYGNGGNQNGSYNYSSTTGVYYNYLMDGSPNNPNSGYYSGNNCPSNPSCGYTNSIDFSYDFSSSANPQIDLPNTSVNFGDGAISASISPVPLPGALVSFSLAMMAGGGLTAIRKRRKRR